MASSDTVLLNNLETWETSKYAQMDTDQKTEYLTGMRKSLESKTSELSSVIQTNRNSVKYNILQKDIEAIKRRITYLTKDILM